MASTSLFERLEADTALYRQGSADEPADPHVEAIKRHLEQLLNSRLGCSQSSPELGLRDFNGITQASSDLVVAISSDIQRLVATFEPRITVTQVRYQPNPNLPQELNFRLDCQVRANHQSEQVRIDVALHGRDGYTQVK